jgi:DNA-binding Lrp family transcriptional regulator
MFYRYLMHTLNSSDIRALEAVFDGRDRLGDIAAALGLSLQRTSFILSGLARRGLIEKKRRGMSETVVFSGSRSAHLFRDLLGRGFPAVECLADSRLTLLSLLAGNGGSLVVRDIATFTGLSGSTVRDAMRAGIRRGVLKRTGSGYAISSRMATLGAFLRSYEEDIAVKVVRTISEKALIHRMFGFEILFSLPPGEKAGGAALTATTAFSRDGVPTRSSRSYYHHVPSGRTLRKEDFLLDNALMEQGNVQNLIISLIYLKMHRRKVDEDYLRLLSRVYGIPSLGDGMLRYIGGEEVEGFPKQAEFAPKYRMYGGQHG